MPVPSPRPLSRPVQDTQSPPCPIVITAQAGISQLSRAESAARDPSLRWGDGWGRSHHRSEGRTMLAQRRGDRRGVASAVPVRSVTPVGYQAERCVARHTSAPSAPLRETPSSPSQERRSAPRLPATTYRPLRPLPRANFGDPSPSAPPESPALAPGAGSALPPRRTDRSRLAG